MNHSKFCTCVLCAVLAAEPAYKYLPDLSDLSFLGQSNQDRPAEQVAIGPIEQPDPWHTDPGTPPDNPPQLTRALTMTTSSAPNISMTTNWLNDIQSGMPAFAPMPTPDVWHTRTDSIVWPPSRLPVTMVNSGTIIEVPAGTLNLQGFAPALTVGRG